MYDLFISYHSLDHAAVELVANALRQRGLRPYLDRWYLIPGRSWLDTLEKSLADCNGAAIFLGPHGMGRWQQREKELALDRQTGNPNFFVIPVLLAGADPALGFLSLNHWVDLRGGPSSEAIETLVCAALGQPPGPELTERLAATIAGVCPYRGLRPFREEDEPFFCGRESFSDMLVGAVERRSLVAVVGASGSGKSSVVRAGLIPRLRRKTDRVWEIATMSPQERPFYSLSTSLHPLLEPELSEVERLRETEKLADALSHGEIKLRSVISRILAKQPGTDRLLLVVDQWEELYTLCRNDAVQHRFISELLDATACAQLLSVVLTLRGDFYGHALADRELSDRIQDGIVNIGPMMRDELQHAIQEPARKVGLRFEDGLIERILDEVGEEPGSLPLVEFLLTELWEKRRNGELLHEAYTAIGGVRRAIAERAEQAFSRLSEQEQEAAHWALLALVVPGEGAEDTRKRAILQELDGVARSVIAKLATDRLLVTTRDTTGRDVVEVGHEALIREWKRLRQWVNENREFLRTLRRLEEEEELWRTNRRPADLLLPPGRRLGEAQELLNSRPQAVGVRVRAYITESVGAEQQRQEQARKEAQRTLNRTRAVAVSVSLLLLVAIGFAYLIREEKKLTASNFYVALQSAKQLVEKTADLQQNGGVLTTPAKELLGIAEQTLGDLDQLRMTTQFSQEVRGEQVSLLLTVADAYYELGLNSKVLALVNTAREMALQLADKQATNPEWQRLLFGSYFRIGDVLLDQHKYQDARAEYESARKIADRHSYEAASEAASGKINWLRDQVFIYSKLGDALRAEKNLTLALEEYNRALNIAQKGQGTDDEVIHLLAATHNRIGQVSVDQDDLDDALSHYRLAMEISHRLAQERPENWGRQYTLAVRYSRIGIVLKKQGNLSGALSEYKHAMEIRRQLTVNDNGNTKYRDALASSYADLGDVLKLQGLIDTAREHFNKALVIRQELVKTDPSNVDWQRSFEVLWKKVDELSRAETKE
jgi:tetratricopeptide (TPR) repeat protein/KaiC/GvpD/RAD55 family RecA-like ATPase